MFNITLKSISNLLLISILSIVVSSCGGGASEEELRKVALSRTILISSPLDSDMITVADGASFTVTGSCSDDGRDIDLNVNNVNTATATCTSNTLTYTFQTSWLNEGANDLNFTYSSVDGTDFDIVLNKDTVVPTLTYAPLVDINLASSTSYTLVATCSEDGAVTGTLGGTAVTGTCTGGALSITGIDASANADGSLSVDLVLTDVNGNPSVVTSTTVNKDTVVPTMTLTTPVDISNVNLTTYSLSGTCSEDGVMAGTLGGIVLAGACAAGVYSLSPIDATLELDGPLSLSLTVTDAAGNTSIAETALITKDTSDPLVALDTLSPINIINNASYSLTGTCSEDTQNVDLTIGSVTSTVVCTGGVFSFTGIDVSGELDSLALNVQVDHYDASLNTAQDIQLVLKDTVAPTLSITAPVTINSLNHTAYSFDGTCNEDGPISGTLGAVVISGTCTGGAYTISSLDVSAEVDGTVALSVIITDAAGNPSVTATDSVTKDVIAPIITLTTPLDIIVANETTYSLDGTCDEDGVVSGTLGAVILAGNCTAGVFTLSPIDTSGEADGTLALSIIVTDAAGNPSIAQTASVLKDTAVPLVALDALNPINIANETSYDLSGTCSEDTQNVDLTIGAVTSSAVCTGGIFTFTGLDISGEFDDLALNVQVDHVDTSLNAAQDIQPVIKDTVLPVLTITTPPAINSLTESSYSFDGTCSEDGPIAGTLGATAFVGTCNVGLYTASLIDVSAELDGSVALSITVTDAAGNESLAATDSVLKDTVAPIVTVTLPVDIGTSNETTYTLDGTCDEDGVVSGTLDAVALSGACTGGVFNLTAIDVSSEPDGGVALSLIVTDAAGNPSIAETATILKDTSVPLIALDALDPINSLNAASYDLSGTCSEDTQNVDLTIGALTSSVVCSGGVFIFTGLDVSGESDNPALNVQVDHADASLNTSQDIQPVLKDTVVPTLTITTPDSVNSLNESTYSFSGTCSEDGDLAGTANSVALVATCSGGVYNFPSLNISGEADGLIVITLAITDAAGNISLDEVANVAKDTIDPLATIDVALDIDTSNQASYSVSGTCSEDTQDVDLTIGSVSANTTCSGGSYSFSGIDVTAVPDSPSLAIIIDHFDAALNTVQVTVNVDKDTLVPLVVFDTPVAINQVNTSSYSLSGTCTHDGRTVIGTLDTIPFSALCSSGVWTASGINTSFLADGTYTVSATTDDGLGNTSAVATDSVMKDTTASLPDISIFNPSSGYGNGGSVVIRVASIGLGYNVEAFSDASCSSSVQSGVSAGATYDMTISNGGEGTYSYYFIVTDTVPNATSCLGPVVYTEDQTAPSDPLSVSMSSPLNGETSSDSTPMISGTISALEEGATIELFRDVSCTDQIGTDTVSSGAFNVLGSLAVDGSQDGLNDFYLKTTDQAGNVSSCYSTGLSYTLDGGGLASLPKLAMVGNDSPSYLVSLEDGNQITWTKVADPNNPVDLGTVNAGSVIQIEDPGNTSDKVDQGDMIESTGPCYVVTEGYGTAPWASEAYAGKSFTTYQYRYGGDSNIYVAAINQTSFVQILQDTDGDGFLDVVDYQNIPAGSVHKFTTNLVDGRPWQISASQNVNVYYVSASDGVSFTRDARVLTPAGKDIIGFSFYLTAIQDNTNVSAYRNQSGATYTDSDLDSTEFIDTGRTLKSSLTNYATRVIADKPVALLQIADQDGINATPHLPINYLATNYGIPRAADYVGVVAPTGVSVTVYNPGGSTVRTTFTLTKNAGAPALAPYAYMYTDGASIPAGTRFVCSGPCFMIYDDEGPGADEDETIMMGYTP